MMKTKRVQESKLPTINDQKTNKGSKTQTTYQRYNSQMQFIKPQKQNHISKILREVRLSMKSSLEQQKSMQKYYFLKEQKQKKRQSYLNRKQKKMYYLQTSPTHQNQQIVNTLLTRFNLTQNSTLTVNEIEALQKPPHRCKTSICIQNDRLYLYGGIGCEQNLKLAVFDLSARKWNFPETQKFASYHPTTPITGHTFGCFKGKGYIYGGTSTDITNELSIVNLKDYKFSQGQKCQYRRKDHAMTLISKFMIIQGGIESNQVSNTLYYFNTQTQTWVYPTVSSTLPFLSHHSMCSTFPFKTKKKQINDLSELIDPIFVFGGKDRKGNLSNALYKLTLGNETVTAVKVEINFAPEPRMQMCFQYVGSGFVVLYGGKMQQSTDEEYQIEQNPVYSLNTQTSQWTMISTSDPLPQRYGMASTVSNGKIYIFGGFVSNRYSNANLTVLTTWNPDLLKSKSNFGTRSVLSGEKYF